MQSNSRQDVRILHVDDEPEFSDITKTFLEREDDRFVVETATSAEEGLQRINDRPPDCVVSDYNMAGMDGLAFLRAVRTDHSDLPFILFTGEGSEAVASDAISAGVTGYLQKQIGTERYELLANRIQNVVTAQRDAREAARQKDLMRRAEILGATGGWELEVESETLRLTDGIKEIYGVETGRSLSLPEVMGFYEPDSQEKVRSVIDDAIENGYAEADALYLQTVDGERRVVEGNAELVDADTESTVLRGVIRDITERRQREQELQNLTDQYKALTENFPDGAVYLIDGDMQYIRARGEELSRLGLPPEDIEGKTPHDLFPESIAEETCHYYRKALNGTASTFEQEFGGNRYRIQTVPIGGDDEQSDRVMAVSKNVTERVSDKRELQRQNDRLEEFADIVSHDLRNPLAVAAGNLELAEETFDSERLTQASDAVQRSQTLVDDLLALARGGDQVHETEPVVLAEVAENSWQTTETKQATLEGSPQNVILADRSRLRQLFENLYRNAVEHGGEGVTVHIGGLSGGFYVADTGPGIQEPMRGAVFEPGYSTNDDGTGFGLRIVEQVAEAHEWEITVTESDYGGARFEFTGVEHVDR